MRPETAASIKAAAVIMLVVVIFVAIGFVFRYVADQTDRCRSIGAEYAGPGECSITHTERMPTP